MVTMKNSCTTASLYDDNIAYTLKCNGRSSRQTSASAKTNNNISLSTWNTSMDYRWRRSLVVMMIIVLFSVAVFPPLAVQSFSFLPSHSGEVSILKLQRQQPNSVFVIRPNIATELSAQIVDAYDDDDGKNDAQRRHNKYNDERASTNIASKSKDDGYDGLGEYDPSEKLPERTRDVPNVGNPQLRVKEKERSVTDILQELAAIQRQGPQKYCILGTRHCSYLHQQIIELLYVFRMKYGNELLRY